MAFETRRIWTSSRLPSLPLVGVKVLELSRRRDVTNQELINALQSDKTLVERIIEVANSPLCDSSNRLINLRQVLEEMGQVPLTSIALSLCIQQACLPIRDRQDEFVSAWQSAVVKAIAAETLCGHLGEGLECEYFLAGLLLDAGRIAILHTSSQEYIDLHEKSMRDWVPIWDVEQRNWGVSSAELGSQLVEQWGFPSRLIQGIQSQYAAVSQLVGAGNDVECPLKKGLALASAIGHYFCGEHHALALFRIRQLTQEVLPLNDADVQQILAKVAQRYSTVCSVLGLDGVQLLPLNELKAKAIEQLTQYCQRTSTTANSRLHSANVKSCVSPVAQSNSTPATAIYDPVTKVFSQESFTDSLQKEVHRCCQTASPLGLALIRVDRMSELSASNGDGFLDALLEHVGRTLQEMLRSADVIGRLDQNFAVIACDPTSKGMQRLSDRIRGKVMQTPLVWEGRTIPLTTCVGATLVLPKRTQLEIGNTILGAAGRALVEATNLGENAIHFESMVDEIELRRLFLSNQFRFSRWLISQGVLDIPRVAKALLDYKQRPMRIGDLAMSQELLNSNQVNLILKDQKESQERFGQIAVRLGLLTEDQLIGLLILQHENPLRVAELFLSLGVLEQNKLHDLLKVYFSTVPWAAPLTSAA